MDWKAGLDIAFSDVLRKRNLLLLVLFWSASLLLVLTYGTISGRLWARHVCPAGATPMVNKNETGAFGAWREAGPEGSYKVEFGNLRAENGAVGIFRTASHKLVLIENLDVTFRSSAPGQDGRLQDFCDLFAPRRDVVSGAQPLGILDEVESQTAAWSIPVDLANATEVRVRDLDWTVCCADRTVLRVSCKYAQLKADASHVVLRGHATVTTPEATLRSNHIKMDVRDECFVVDGRYVLTRDRRTHKGSGARFDKTLRPLRVERLDAREDEKWANGLQLGAF